MRSIRLDLSLCHAGQHHWHVGCTGELAGTASKLASTLKFQAMPTRPARLSTPDSQDFVFNCEPGAKQMFLDRPSVFKYSDK